MAKYDAFSREELIELLQKQDKELALKKYGLVWDNEKEPEQVVIDCAKKLPILKNTQEKDIKTNDDDYNIMIEGDNYHALQVLNYTHKEKIDVIYIDPPYNTGNKDFIYNDKFVDKEDGYRHSKWLNFMEKRLELAKELLKDDGVIFISIDEHEQANLNLLCDKIFGPDNFIENIVWDKKAGAKGVPPLNMMVNVHEYIVAYTKGGKFKFQGEKRNAEQDGFKNPDNDPRGPWRESNIKSTTIPKDRAFTITDPSTGKEYTNTWAFSKDTLEKMIQEGRILWKANLPKQKEYLREMTHENKAIKSTWGVFDAQSTTVFLKDLIPNAKFDNPKPLSLMQYLISVSTSKSDLILDFFAGSGTTGHAILEQNKQDGGNRRFILCTNNEGNIATDVCYPRIQKIIEGYHKNGDKEFIEGLGGNLKYFKTDFVNNSKNTTQTKINLAKECSEMICLKTGRFNELQSNNASFKIFSNNANNQYTCIYFDCFDTEMHDFISEIKKLHGQKELYIFSLTNTIDSSLFKGVADIKVEAIPYKILDLYRRIAKAHIKGSDND